MHLSEIALLIANYQLKYNQPKMQEFANLLLNSAEEKAELSVKLLL